MRGALAPITIAALRHLSANGATPLATIKAAITGLETGTMNNLVQLGHALRTESGLCITPRGRAKLQGIDNPDRAAPAPKAAKPAPAAPQLSNNELDAAIIATLTAAGRGLPLTTLAHRVGQPINVVRPAVTMLSQRGRLHSSTSKPPRYSLPETVGRTATRPTGTYAGTELQRNPGIGPERYAAFDLPSRMGNRLHYPDGRVLPA